MWESNIDLNKHITKWETAVLLTQKMRRKNKGIWGKFRLIESLQLFAPTQGLWRQSGTRDNCCTQRSSQERNNGKGWFANSLNLLKQAMIHLCFQRPHLVIPTYAQQENCCNVKLCFGSAALRTCRNPDTISILQHYNAGGCLNSLYKLFKFALFILNYWNKMAPSQMLVFLTSKRHELNQSRISCKTLTSVMILYIDNKVYILG